MEECSGLHDDVETVDIVASYVASLLVIDKGVEGFALIGPHLGAVVTLDDGPVATGLAAISDLQRRPLNGAFIIAVGLARHILVKGVERGLVLAASKAVFPSG